MKKLDWDKKLAFKNVMTHRSVIYRNLNISMKIRNIFVKNWDYDQKWAF